MESIMIEYRLFEEIQNIKELISGSRAKRLMTIKDVSDYSRLSISTIRRQVRLGTLKVMRTKGKLLFNLKDVNRWLNA
jgi:excisionase family DNA binding protein